MFLKRIIISSVSEVIRDIPFIKNGVNLIVDKSTSKETESGNSIGKTTLLRVVDYCLGSEGEDIYTDQEFDIKDEAVLNFLTSNSVKIKLILGNDKEDISLERNFGTPEILRINEEDVPTISDYRKKIESYFFGIKDSKPSIRQLMPKFIRKDTHSMSNTLKFLHATTTGDEYDLLFFSLFGFSDKKLLNDRFFVKKDIKNLSAKVKAYKNGKSIVVLRETLKSVEKDITAIESKVANFEFDEAYESETNKLSIIRGDISTLTNEIANLDIKLSLNNDTLSELIHTKTKIDPTTIKELYEEAKVILPSVQKEFEDVLIFHNKLIGNKIEFIERGIKEIKSLISDKSKVRKDLLIEEGNILRMVSKKGPFRDVYFLQKELNQLYEKRGKESAIIEEIKSLEDLIKSKTKELEKIEDRLSLSMGDFEQNISHFNDSFSDYSRKLYEEEYILSFESGNGKASFKIDNIQGNVGGGKKKAQVAAFDLAYISFLEKMNSNIFRFVMHDSIEDVHGNQIKTLFNIADSINGQYIVTILNDKLGMLTEDYVESHKIIELSETDKFFRF